MLLYLIYSINLNEWISFYFCKKKKKKKKKHFSITPKFHIHRNTYPIFLIHDLEHEKYLWSKFLIGNQERLYDTGFFYLSQSNLALNFLFVNLCCNININLLCGWWVRFTSLQFFWTCFLFKIIYFSWKNMFVSYHYILRLLIVCFS